MNDNDTQNMVALCHCGKAFYAVSMKHFNTDPDVRKTIHGYMKEGFKIRTKSNEFVRNNFSDHPPIECSEKDKNKQPETVQTTLF